MSSRQFMAGRLQLASSYEVGQSVSKTARRATAARPPRRSGLTSPKTPRKRCGGPRTRLFGRAAARAWASCRKSGPRRPRRPHGFRASKSRTTRASCSMCRGICLGATRGRCLRCQGRHGAAQAAQKNCARRRRRPWRPNNAVRLASSRNSNGGQQAPPPTPPVQPAQGERRHYTNTRDNNVRKAPCSLAASAWARAVSRRIGAGSKVPVSAPQTSD